MQAGRQDMCQADATDTRKRRAGKEKPVVPWKVIGKSSGVKKCV